MCRAHMVRIIIDVVGKFLVNIFLWQHIWKLDKCIPLASLQPPYFLSLVRSGEKLRNHCVTNSRGWRDDSAVQSLRCSFREPKFGFQCPPSDSSQPAVIQLHGIPDPLLASLGVCTQVRAHTHAHAQLNL